MIHSSNAKPKIFPYVGLSNLEIDRVQDLSAGIALNREKIKEVGRELLVDWRTSIPTANVTLKQFEYGNIEFFQALANKSAVTYKLDLTDFKTSKSDIAVYKTDDSGTFLGTVWYPALRTSGFNITIGDPQAAIERGFTLIGEDEILFQNNNKYLIYFSSTSGVTGSYTMTIGSGALANYPDPVLDPDNSGSYILKIVRVRSGVATTLTTADYTYNSGTKAIVVTASTGDIYRVWYSATTDTNDVMGWTKNDTDAATLEADSAIIYLTDLNGRQYRLQSVSIDVAYERTDYREIGNDEVVLYGARNKTVKITLGRSLENYSLEEYLRGVSGSSYGKIDARKLLTSLTLKVMIYSDDTHNDFRIGYQFTGLAPTNLDSTTPVDEYLGRTITLEGEDGFISSDHTDFH